MPLDLDRLITDRARRLDASGIRKVAALGRSMPGAINLSIGQPEFPVPARIKQAAVDAINADQNAYSPNPGEERLRAALADHLRRDLGWDVAPPGAPPTSAADLIVTGGTSGAILLAALAVCGPGDELIIPDPYFVMYPHVATICGAAAVRCDTYPDFRLTAERVEPLITPRTKAILWNSPGNPSGVVTSTRQNQDLLDLCRRRNILLIADEIYDEFTFADHRTEAAPGLPGLRCPSPARLAGAEHDVLLVRGFGKTYGVTGWRLGYLAGPRPLVEQIVKLQQYSFVCAATPLQLAMVEALRTDMTPFVDAYQRRRDRVLERLAPLCEIARPGGAFYAFFKVPPRLGLSATAFFQKALERQLLVIPGNVFSPADTHVRISFATADDKLDRGLSILADLLSGKA